MIDFRKIRREILKKIIPDFIWPKEVVLDGAVIPLRESPFSFGIKRYLVLGEYESAERVLVGRYLSRGDQVIEMGGSIGVLTAIIAKKIGVSGRLVSIEADEKLVNYSKSWIESSPCVTIVNGYAIPIYENSSNLKGVFREGNGSLGGSVDFVKSNDRVGTVFFDIATLSNSFQIKPNILVVDIEGSESILLETSPKLPSNIKVLIIELHPMIYGMNKMKLIIDQIVADGFKLSELIDDVYVFIRL